MQALGSGDASAANRDCGWGGRGHAGGGAPLAGEHGGRITLIERSDRIARGVAYSTTFPDHLLNVVAANMGGLADDPGHFRSWLAEYRQPVRATSFMPRVAYGDYLEHLLERAIADSNAGAIRRVQAEAVG